MLQQMSWNMQSPEDGWQGSKCPSWSYQDTIFPQKPTAAATGMLSDLCGRATSSSAGSPLHAHLQSANEVQLSMSSSLAGSVHSKLRVVPKMALCCRHPRLELVPVLEIITAQVNAG